METTRPLIGVLGVTALMLIAAVWITEQSEPQPITIEVPVEVQADGTPTAIGEPVAEWRGEPAASSTGSARQFGWRTGR